MKQDKTIFRKTFEPVLAILLLLMGIYTIIINFQVVSYLKENAYDVLREQTINCRDYMEGKMLGQWSAINDNVEAIIDMIEKSVSRKGKQIGDIAEDTELNQAVLMEITEYMIDMMKTGSNTEMFLILDGEAVSQELGGRAGVYIRNSSPGTYNENNDSFLYERGVPAISKNYQLSLGSFWKPAFYLEEGRDDYFFKPLEAARQSENKDFENFGYWSYGKPIDISDKSILLYSIPLISRHGQVFGVLGVGVDELSFMKSIPSNSVESRETKAYLLARGKGEGKLEPLIVQGKAYSKTDFIGHIVTISGEGTETYLENTGVGKELLCANWQPLGIYSPNTPFEEEIWGIIGIQKENDLLYRYHMAQNLLLVLLVGSIAVCSACVLWFSRFLSKPIKGLVQELRDSDPNRPICLGKVNIVEVDKLTESIEELSQKVAAAYSKISTILEMTDVGIAVFEYKEKENSLFCNEEFYEMMGWEQEEGMNPHKEGERFGERMAEWLSETEGQSVRILEIPDKNGSKKWLRLTQIYEQDTFLGVITDVTAEILEKKKIEHERDYDVLTDLLNRRAFEDRIEEILKAPERVKLGVMMVWDLDNLKYVNDAYGHSIGDEYICAFSDRLKQLDGENTISARRSGDEFITFVYGYLEEEALRRKAQEIWELASQAEITLPNGKGYRVRVSMGQAWYPKDASDYRSMFEYADFAMYIVKHSQKGTRMDFDEYTYRENRILLRGQEAFNNLMENRLVKYMMQPIVNVRDGEIYGYEMLMRSDLEAFRNPAEILRMAHSQSRLYEVEVMTWFEAMKCYVKKVEEGAISRESKVFINSIANQIMNEEKLSLFAETFKDYLSNIVCEFIEEEEGSHQMSQYKLQCIREWSGQTAIDDYGCGYNSEAVLLQLSPDIVKIDIGIVRGIHEDKDRQQLVANLVRYGKERGIRILGEGVETKEEMETLVRLGVDYLQGYYVARPSYEAAPPSLLVKTEILDAWKRFRGGGIRRRPQTPVPRAVKRKLQDRSRT